MLGNEGVLIKKYIPVSESVHIYNTGHISLDIRLIHFCLLLREIREIQAY